MISHAPAFLDGLPSITSSTNPIREREVLMCVGALVTAVGQYLAASPHFSQSLALSYYEFSSLLAEGLVPLLPPPPATMSSSGPKRKRKRVDSDNGVKETPKITKARRKQLKSFLQKVPAEMNRSIQGKCVDDPRQLVL